MARTITGETIFLAEFARGFENQTITDHTFENCAIEGPAVLIPVDCEFTKTVFGVHPDSGLDSLLWEPPKGPRAVVGGVAAVRCIFRRCNFVGVGFLLDEEMAKQFRDQIASPPS